MAKSRLKPITPTAVNRTVAPTTCPPRELQERMPIRRAQSLRSYRLLWGGPGIWWGGSWASGWARRPRAPGEKSRALIDAHQAIRLTIANTAAFKKKTCAMFRARGDFLSIGDTPLSEHDRTLGFHDHHAA